jgi:hypothetical protein
MDKDARYAACGFADGSVRMLSINTGKILNILSYSPGKEELPITAVKYYFIQMETQCG